MQQEEHCQQCASTFCIYNMIVFTMKSHHIKRPYSVVYTFTHIYKCKYTHVICVYINNDKHNIITAAQQ